MRREEEAGRPPAPTLRDHSGLDTDEATDKGKMMTAHGAVDPDADDSRDAGVPTLEDHPGLDADEATPEGKQMTALGSTGPGEGPEEAHNPGSKSREGR
jgi:hypothetical protein